MGICLDQPSNSLIPNQRIHREMLLVSLREQHESALTSLENEAALVRGRFSAYMEYVDKVIIIT